MFNPYFIIAALLSLLCSFGAGEWHGNRIGKLTQSAADQLLFRKYEADITAQKAKANNLYQAALEANVVTMAERDKFKTTLENEYAAHQATTNQLHAQYASNRLRYSVTATDSGCRTSSSGTQVTSSDPSITTFTSELQLPDEITSNLQQLAFDADQLADAYRKCYDYAQQVK
jgi:hypothetical protein